MLQSIKWVNLHSISTHRYDMSEKFLQMCKPWIITLTRVFRTFAGVTQLNVVQVSPISPYWLIDLPKRSFCNCMFPANEGHWLWFYLDQKRKTVCQFLPESAIFHTCFLFLTVAMTARHRTDGSIVCVAFALTLTRQREGTTSDGHLSLLCCVMLLYFFLHYCF